MLVLVLAVAWVRMVFAQTETAPSPANQLTAAEKAAGWTLLFDGRTTQGWRSFGKKEFPAQGWVVEDGWLKKVAGLRGGDIITDQLYGNFELEWEWRLAPRGNNGVKYFITEERPSAIGHEYQMLDDLRGPRGKGSTASFYDVVAPRPDAPLKPAWETNRSRILIQGDHVEHWLNGIKVLEYQCGSPEVRAAVAQSKFKSVPGFGNKVQGHILLTDHGSEAWFRNVKLRPLP